MHGEILRREWPTYLNGFTKRNSGRVVDLQVLSEELGTQNKAEKFPFQAISLETKGSIAQMWRSCWAVAEPIIAT
jgi:Family of unknown function (DUF5335)